MTTQIIKTDLKRNKTTLQWWKSFNFKGFRFYFLFLTLPLCCLLRNGQYSGLSTSKGLQYTVTQGAFFLSHWDREDAGTEMWRQAHCWTKPSPSRTGGKSEWVRKVVCWFCGVFFFSFMPVCTISFQATSSNIYIYQDKQVPHALSLSGINSSEPAACLTCLEILMEFQEPLAMNCLCFSIKIKKHLLTVPMAKEQK